MSAADEIVAIVDERNHCIGAATRGEMRARGLIHRSTYILVFNPKGELFVQKRSFTKDVYPGYYEPVAGGVVLTEESYQTGARRELEEELGIRDIALCGLFEFYFEDGNLRVWGAAFSCVYDGKIVIQQEEVESGAFLAVQDVLNHAKAQPFTPDGMYVLNQYLHQRTQ